MKKNEKQQYRQGDVFIERVDDLPTGLKDAKPDERGVVLAEGEATGHHHRIGPMFRSAKLYIGNEGDKFVSVAGVASPRVLELETVLNLDICGKAPLPAGQREPLRAEALALGAVALTHEEHGEHILAPGNYKMPNGVQREYHPDAVRSVED